VLNAIIKFFAPPPKIGRKKFGGGRILFFRRIFGQPNFFGGFSAGPNFSATAAKFGG